MESWQQMDMRGTQQYQAHTRYCFTCVYAMRPYVGQGVLGTLPLDIGLALGNPTIGDRVLRAALMTLRGRVFLTLC